MVLSFTVVMSSASADPGFGSSSLNSVFKLVGYLLALVLIFVLARQATKFMGKNRQGGGSRGRNIDVVESRAIGVGSSIFIVRAGGKVLLIGATKDNISLLTELNADEIEETKRFAPFKATTFQSVFRGFMKRGNTGGKPEDESIAEKFDELREEGGEK